MKKKIKNIAYKELDKYVSHADKTDYLFAIASGLCAGIIDSVFVGEFSLENAHLWGSEKTEQFVYKIASKDKEFKGADVKAAIKYLADGKKLQNGKKNGYHLASDANMADFGGTKQHHLRDFSHHASLTGLIFSILTQFTGKVYGTCTSGKFIILDVKDTEFIGKDIPEKLLFGTVYWFFHLVSDVAGSGGESEGTGIPGPLLSAAKLLAATPLFNNQLDENGNRELSVFISKLFNGTFFGSKDKNGKMKPLRFDFRTELGISGFLGKQATPVIMNEVFVKTFYFLRRFVNEIAEKEIASFRDLQRIEWDHVKPSGYRTIDRMMTISTLTFTVADTSDAAIRAAIESGGSWVLFTGKFVTKINYVGAGRTIAAVKREISDEMKEEQLLHERRLLEEKKSELIIKQLQKYKSELEEKVTSYLAEDIEVFMTGFDYVNSGLNTNDSDLVIHGNTMIQRAIGKEVQFENQKDFDDLMVSDKSIKL